jgi:catechol 2,3-dioxygenase-like lactoylglutathione lyase family enzyme
MGREARLLSIAPQLQVPDVARSAAHYRDALGFTVEALMGQPPGYAILARDGVEIHVARRPDGKAEPPSGARPGGLDAYVFVDDLEALVGELAWRGAEIVEGPLVQPYGMKEVVVRDPDGFRIAFGEQVRPDSI